MSTTFNRKTIMANAHFMARWREANGKTYRARFADMGFSSAAEAIERRSR